MDNTKAEDIQKIKAAVERFDAATTACRAADRENLEAEAALANLIGPGRRVLVGDRILSRVVNCSQPKVLIERLHARLD
jgi:peptidyl-tRNA hydrolase